MIRITVALIIGFLLSSKLKDFITSRVIRYMPQKYRVTDDFFHLQARISMVFSVVIAIGTAFLLNSAMVSIRNTVFGTSEDVISTTSSETIYELENENREDEMTEKQSQNEAPNNELTDDYYLQIDAYKTLEKAEAVQQLIAKRFPAASFVGFKKDKNGSYKVLIGPFEDITALKAFKKRRKLDGFPRKRSTLRWIAQ